MNGLIGSLCGSRVIADANYYKMQVKKWCRSKKKRIRKKWAKNIKNLHSAPALDEIMVMGDTIICHPSVYTKIKKATES